MPRRTLQMPRNETKPAGMPTARHAESMTVDAPTSRQASGQEFRPQTLNTDDLDIPTFLRNRR